MSELQGQLNAFVSRKNSEISRIERLQQQVKGQQTTLGRTELTMPFDARIEERFLTDISTGQMADQFLHLKYR